MDHRRSQIKIEHCRMQNAELPNGEFEYGYRVNHVHLLITNFR